MKVRKTWLFLAVAVLGFAAAALYFARNLHGSPDAKMDPPAADAHWTLHTAYELDRFEQEHHGFAAHGITTKPAEAPLGHSPDEHFDVRLAEYYTGNPMRCVIVRHDGSAVASRTTYYRDEQDPQGGYKPQFVKAEFKLTDAERTRLRMALIEAEVFTAPAKISREKIYDGLQVELSVRSGHGTKTTWFSNALPEQYRDLMVLIWRDICAPHASEIDMAPLTKGFVEFTGADTFRE